jgi:hypothetical protein
LNDGWHPGSSPDAGGGQVRRTDHHGMPDRERDQDLRVDLAGAAYQL